LEHALENSPRDFGFHMTGWTSGLLQTLLQKTLGFRVSEHSVRSKLHELGYVWKRFRYTLRPDPQRDKKGRIRNAVSDLPVGTAILFEDETEVTLFPPLRSGWTKRGDPADVVISGGNAKRVVFGSLSLTGHRLLLVRRHQRSEDFQEFLQLVHHHPRGRPVCMLLDGDNSHTAAGSEHLAADLGIRLERLPVRSPELNAIEDLWDDAKDYVCANHQYPDIENQTDAFVQRIEGHTNHRAKKLAGLLSDSYWLFQ
jgi:transposase